MGNQIENWKDIDGYEGLYKISSLGNVKSTHKKIEIILKPKKDKYGYLTFTLAKNSAKRSQTIHRSVAIAFIDNPENKPQVNHINGIKHDNSFLNLEWVTQSENQIHAIDNNLQPVGEKHYKSVLKERDIINIRNLQGLKTLTEIAYDFNVGKATVRDILRGKTWKHVKLN
jgi:hypothetical protein